MLRVLFAERLGRVDEVPMNEVFRKYIIHSLRSVEESMRNKKKIVKHVRM